MLKRFAALFSLAILAVTPLAAQTGGGCWQNGVACASIYSQISDVTQNVNMVTSGSVNADPVRSLLFLHATGLIGAFTVILPPNPVDGQREIITSDSVVTVLTINGNGIPVTNPITGIVVGGWARYAYSATYNAWFRTG